MSDDEIREDLPLATDEADAMIVAISQAIEEDKEMEERVRRVRESQEDLDRANAMLEWVQGLRP